MARPADWAQGTKNRNYCPACQGRYRTADGMIAEIKRAAPNAQVSVTYVRLSVVGLASGELNQFDLQSLC